MKDFRLNKLEYACTLNGIIHILTANKSDKYFLDEEMTIPLVFCSGDINTDYWRTEPNIDESIIKNYIGSSESIEHINAKRRFHKSLKLEYGYETIVGASAVMEYYVKEINKTIDVVYLDESGKVLVGIEVFCTNRKTDDDIKKFNKVNFPIYEYNNNTTAIYPISAGDTDTEEIKEMLNRISKSKQVVNEVYSRIRDSEKFILELKERIELEGKRYYSIKSRNEDLSDESLIELKRRIKQSNYSRRECIAEMEYLNGGGCESLRDEVNGFEEARRNRFDAIENKVKFFKEDEDREIESLRVQIDRLESRVKDVPRIKESLSSISREHSEYLKIKNRNEEVSREIIDIERDIETQVIREHSLRREINNYSF